MHWVVESQVSSYSAPKTRSDSKSKLIPIAFQGPSGPAWSNFGKHNRWGPCKLRRYVQVKGTYRGMIWGDDWIPLSTFGEWPLLEMLAQLYSTLGSSWKTLQLYFVLPSIWTLIDDNSDYQRRKPTYHDTRQPHAISPAFYRDSSTCIDLHATQNTRHSRVEYSITAIALTFWVTDMLTGVGL